MSTPITPVVMKWILIDTRSFTGGNRLVASMSLRSMFESLPNSDLNHTFPGRCVTLYTVGEISPHRPFLDGNSNYAWSGQPRTGNRNRLFAELVERTIGTEGIYRCKSCTQMPPLLRNDRNG